LALQPEQQRGEKIDVLLKAAAGTSGDAAAANIHAARGVASREFPPGYASRLSAVCGRQAAGVIEAKKEGVTLTGVETQSDKYTKGCPPIAALEQPIAVRLPDHRHRNPLTNGLDPVPRSRPVLAFHQPKLLAESWLRAHRAAGGGQLRWKPPPPSSLACKPCRRSRKKASGPAQITAIRNWKNR